MRESAETPADPTEDAPIKTAGRESVGRPTDSYIESAGRLTNFPTESVGKPADTLPAHFIGAASDIGVVYTLDFGYKFFRYKVFPGFPTIVDLVD